MQVLAFDGCREVNDRRDGDGNSQADTTFERPSGLVKASHQFSDELKLTASVSRTENSDFGDDYQAFARNFAFTMVDRKTADTSACVELKYNPLGSEFLNLTARNSNLFMRPSHSTQLSIPPGHAARLNGTGEFFDFAPTGRLQLTLGKRFLNGTLDLSVEALHARENSRTGGTSYVTATGDSPIAPSAQYTVFNVIAGYTPDTG